MREIILCSFKKGKNKSLQQRIPLHVSKSIFWLNLNKLVLRCVSSSSMRWPDVVTSFNLGRLVAGVSLHSNVYAVCLRARAFVCVSRIGLFVWQKFHERAEESLRFSSYFAAEWRPESESLCMCLGIVSFLNAAANNDFHGIGLSQNIHPSNNSITTISYCHYSTTHHKHIW